MKTIELKKHSLQCHTFTQHFFQKTLQLCAVIILYSLNSQPLHADENGRIFLEVDHPQAMLYLNGEKKGKLNIEGQIELSLIAGNYHLFIEHPIKNSVYSYQAKRIVTILPADSLELKLELKRALSPAWEEHFQVLLKHNKKTSQDYPVLNRLTMLDIPTGEFMMGSSDVMFAKPAHRVRVPAFKLSKNEMTFKIYDQFVQQTGYDIPEDAWGRGNQPVTNVSWYDAQLFIQWLNSVTKPSKPYRLPTEAEWEYATRAGTQTKYWWGDEVGQNRANCSGCFGGWSRRTRPVGTYSANPFGLYDTSGNVFEWVQDCWNSHYNGAPNNGSPWLSGYCKYRVIRGGSWFFNEREILSASRTWNTPTKRDSTIGFRLAQDK